MTAPEWWETFFDDAYVEAWADGGFFARSDEDAAAVAALLAVAPGDEVLDVGCGFGRIARPLHDRGYRVTGIDASAAQLRLAAEHNPGPRYLQGDMREPPDGPFDAVVNLFSSFGYFDDRADDVAALRAWARVLRPGGVRLSTATELVAELTAAGFSTVTVQGDLTASSPLSSEARLVVRAVR